MTERTGEWHQQRIRQFMAAKESVGEPSPHMKMVVAMSDGLPIRERFWRAGCYAVPYSVLTAEAIWSEFPLPGRGMKKWVAANWPGIHTRRERRAVRSPEKFARSLESYADWLDTAIALSRHHIPDARERYDLWWKSATSVYGLGRYITIRLLETIRRSVGVDLELYDIRAIDASAWSPIRGLALLYPEHREVLMAGDVRLASQLGEHLYDSIRASFPNARRYVVAAMLCEYRKAFEDRAEYPGRTLDQELEYSHGSHAAYWGGPDLQQQLLAVRSRLFPHPALGERQGWGGVRKELGTTLRDHGYVWSDLLFSYRRTNDLAGPVA